MYWYHCRKKEVNFTILIDIPRGRPFGGITNKIGLIVSFN